MFNLIFYNYVGQFYYFLLCMPFDSSHSENINLMRKGNILLKPGRIFIIEDARPKVLFVHNLWNKYCLCLLNIC